MCDGRQMPHVEMIVDYLVDGPDYLYCDNRGVLVRCGRCIYFNADKERCTCLDVLTTKKNYCSWGRE